MKKFCSIFFVYGVHLFFAEIFFWAQRQRQFQLPLRRTLQQAGKAGPVIIFIRCGNTKVAKAEVCDATGVAHG
jgi:hypothetical protein